MKRLYLAGPAGFSEIGSHGLIPLENLLQQHFIVMNPFKEAQKEGQVIAEIQKKLSDPDSNTNFAQSVHELHILCRNIGQKNASLIQSCEVIFAVLDGSDVDSGTAAEIGYSYGLQKLILGYRSDFRIAGDNYGSNINLQVEFFIESSNGRIFTSLDDIRDHITEFAK